jgi:hypothetical protein
MAGSRGGIRGNTYETANRIQIGTLELFDSSCSIPRADWPRFRSDEGSGAKAILRLMECALGRVR